MTSISQNEGRSAALVARAFAIYAIAGSSLTLVGWYAGMRRLVDWDGDGITMFVNTAVMTLAAGLALVLLTANSGRARMLSRVLAGLVVLMGGATFFEHLSGINLGIDTLLYRHYGESRAAMAPGRPGPPASISLTLMGIALLLASGSYRVRRAVPVLGIVVAAITSLSLIGYLFNADPLFAVARFTGIAAQSASMILALAMGAIAAIPERQPMRTLCSGSGTGMLARRILPVIVILPIVFGWLQLKGQVLGFYDSRLGVALIVLALIAVLCMLLWWCVGMVREREKALRLKESTLLQEISERQHTQQSLSKRVHEQAAVYQFTDRLHRADTLPEVYEAALDCIHSALGCDRTSILLFDEGKVMRFVGWRGLSDGYRDAVEGHSPWKPGDKSPEPICIKDVAVADVPEELKAVVLGEGIRALAFIPLVTSGEVAGKFMAYYNVPHAFTRSEVDCAMTIARQLSSGLERKRGEEKLRQAVRKAQAASRAKDDFLAALSHELRTPLTPALLAVAALAEESELPADVRDQLAMVARNIQLEARLIDDLLDLTRVSHGKLKIEPMATDLHDLLGLARETVRKDAEAKRVTMDFSLEARECHVLADPARLQQVFWNLLKNAVKFTPAGGKVTVRSFNPVAGRVAVSVDDTGIGITPDALDGIFFAFDQGGLEGRHEFGGLGLGLSISKAIVDLHGGELRAFSEGRGKGASFILELDTAAVPSKPARADSSTPAKMAPLRVLVVDDHEATLAAVSRLLERDGHSVFCASCVDEALKQAGANECDMVISDVGLPDGTGFELMSEIRRRHGWPGIALTGYGMEADLRSSAASGFAVHLVKPVDVSQLREAIKATLSQTADGSGNGVQVRSTLRVKVKG